MCAQRKTRPRRIAALVVTIEGTLLLPESCRANLDGD